MRAFLDKLTFGAAALSLGLLLAFMAERGIFGGMSAGARTILFGLLLAAFVVVPYVIQSVVNRQVRSRYGAGFALVGLAAAVGLGLLAYTAVLLGGTPDSLDAVVFMAVPLWQAFFIGLAYGLKRAVGWYKRQRARDKTL